MFKEKFIRLNVAFKMPAYIAEAAVELSKRIAEKEDSYFVLDGVNFIPHATIYSPEYPERNLEKVIETAEEIAKELSPIEIVFKNLRSDREFGGFIIVSFENTNEVKNIHEKIVLSLNPLREGNVREKDADIEGIQGENVGKYGYPMVMDLYDPHLTITRLKNEDAAVKIAEEIDWRIKSFKVDTIMICEMGEHGTCVKILKEFKLER